MYPFIVKIVYWDDFDTPWVKNHTHVMLYAESMSAAVAQVEKSNYVPNIEALEIMSAGDASQMFEIPGHIAKILVAGGGNYREGLREVKSSVVRDKLHDDAQIIHEGFMKGDSENELDA